VAGEKSPSEEAFDVFICPLIQDFQKLWEGISAIDMSKATRMRNNVLRYILFWIVHDFLAFGLV
jgi:hypothetical protein